MGRAAGLVVDLADCSEGDSRGASGKLDQDGRLLGRAVANVGLRALGHARQIRIRSAGDADPNTERFGSLSP